MINFSINDIIFQDKNIRVTDVSDYLMIYSKKLSFKFYKILLY